MHPDLSPSNHSPECNLLIDALKNCHQQHKFRKFVGFCNEANDAMLKCLKQEREQRRKQNADKSLARRQKNAAAAEAVLTPTPNPGAVPM